MPASLRKSANWFNRDPLSSWDPIAGWSDEPVLGRRKRIDSFVSLWHRSTRREHIYLHADEASVTTPIGLRHNLSGVPYIISQTEGSDFWQGGDLYARMWRAHRVEAPSGGLGQWVSMATEGSGDDLGPVKAQTPVPVLLDFELRTASQVRESPDQYEGEYIATISRNAMPLDGDLLLAGDSTPYQTIEVAFDSGYRIARVIQRPSRYRTATFELRSATQQVFDPVTGTLTGGTPGLREVSVQVSQQSASGQSTLPQGVSEHLNLHVYRRHIGFTPWLGQVLTLAGRSYRIIRIGSGFVDSQIALEVSP